MARIYSSCIRVYVSTPVHTAVLPGVKICTRIIRTVYTARICRPYLRVVRISLMLEQYIPGTRKVNHSGFYWSHGVTVAEWHHQDHMQVICTSLETDNHANTSPLSSFIVRMPFLLPNQQHQST